jgi:hypothetical protein
MVAENLGDFAGTSTKKKERNLGKHLARIHFFWTERQQLRAKKATPVRRDTGRQERCHGEQTLKAVIPAMILNPAADPRHSLVLTYPSEKYEFVSWDHYSQYIEK